MSVGNKRIASIDILRGITIAGMVLCANIGFNSGLPTENLFRARISPDAKSIEVRVTDRFGRVFLEKVNR